MKNKSVTFLVGILALAAIVAFLAYSQWTTLGKAEPCARIGYLDITASAPLYVAQHMDLFAENEICVELQRMATSNQLVDGLAAGRIDYVVETSAAPALALEAASPGRFYVTAASSISEEDPFDAIVVSKSSDIHGLSDLAGKKIAVFPGTTATSLLSAYLESNGVETNGIQFAPTPPPNLLASVRSGAADAAHVYEPAWTIARLDDEFREIHGTVYGKQLSPNPQGISVIRRGFVDENPQFARRVVSAFDSALLIMRSDNASTRAALRSHFSLPESVINEMHLLFMSPSEDIDWASLDSYAALLTQVGELAKQPAINSLRLPSVEK